MELTITKDTKDLKRLEGIIARNLQSFYEVGAALVEIRDRGIPGYEKEIELWENLFGGRS